MSGQGDAVFASMHEMMDALLSYRVVMDYSRATPTMRQQEWEKLRSRMDAFHAACAAYNAGGGPTLRLVGDS